MRLLKIGVSQQQRNLIDIISPEFIILVNTELAGSPSDTMQLPIRGTDMTIDWGDGYIQEGVTQTSTPSSENWITHQYINGGIYQIKIGGGLNWIYFRFGDFLKLLEIQNWGTTQWSSMHAAFRGCANMIGTFTDAPDLTNVTSMVAMFRSAHIFNSDISNWNVSNVTSMASLFYDAHIFNSDISNWNVSNVTSMAYMFAITSFNQDIGNWNVSNVTDMTQMFYFAQAFNRDLSRWCVQNIPSLPNNFDASAHSWTLPRPIWGTCPQT